MMRATNPSVPADELIDTVGSSSSGQGLVRCSQWSAHGTFQSKVRHLVRAAVVAEPDSSETCLAGRV
jgi:hypothetical protein